MVDGPDTVTQLPRRVLVTGADGTIGSAVCSALTANGVEVTGLSQHWRARVPFTALTGDITSETDVSAAVKGMDAVVHLAALGNPTLGTPYEVYRNNTDGTFNVLAQAGEHGIGRAVIASSINATGIPFNRHRPLPAYYPIDEALPPDLEDAYSLSKRSDEMTAQMAARRWDMTVIALRFPAVLRPEWLPSFAANASEKEVREGWSYLLLDDAARVVLRSLVAPVTGASVFALAADHTYMDEPTETLLDRYAPNVPRRRPIPGRQAAVDTTLAREVLRFVPSDTCQQER